MSVPDIFEEDELELVVSFGGRYPKGSTITAVFYKGEGTSGEVLGRVEKAADNTFVTLKWKAKGPSDSEASSLVTWEVKLPESGRESQKDRGAVRVWMRAIKVTAKNADADDAFFAGARFEVAQRSSTKVFELAAGDEQGFEVELSDYAVPEVRWASPYELVEWVSRGGRTWEARVRKPVFLARFRQAPERDNEPEEGTFKRKQHVNVTPGYPAAHDEGHRIELLVGADIPSREGWEVWIDVRFGNAERKFSRRTEPMPTLVDFDEELDDRAWGEALDSDLTDVVHESDQRFVRFRKKGVLQPRAGMEPDDCAALFSIELGQAGGDVCTVRIGSTPECKDQTLEITNWRRIGYNLFCPGPALSTQGGFEAGNPDFPSAVKSKVDRELAKAFVEYVKTSAQFYAPSAWPEFLPRGVHDGKLVGKGAGKKVFVIEEAPLRALAERLRPHAQKPWEHTIVVADYITEVKPAMPDGSVAAKLTSASKTLTLCDSKWGVFKFDKDHKRPSIHYIELKVTKVSGKTLTDEKRAELKKAAGPLAKWFDAGGVRVWSRRGTGEVDACALRDRYVEHLSTRKIKLTLPASNADDPGKLFANYSGVTVEAVVFFEKRDPNSCLGMAYGGTGGLMVLPTLAGDVDTGKLHTTVVHELSHVFGMAYGGRGDLRTSGRSRANPGVLFRHAVDGGGYVYDERGHQGGHCAYGLSAKDRKEPSYEAGFSLTGARMNFAPKCLNWGNEVVLRTKGLTLCNGCAAALRSQGLDDLGAIE